MSLYIWVIFDTEYATSPDGVSKGRNWRRRLPRYYTRRHSRAGATRRSNTYFHLVVTGYIPMSAAGDNNPSNGRRRVSPASSVTSSLSPASQRLQSHSAARSAPANLISRGSWISSHFISCSTPLPFFYSSVLPHFFHCFTGSVPQSILRRARFRVGNVSVRNTSIIVFGLEFTCLS